MVVTSEPSENVMLYGYPGAEYLHLDIEDAIEEQWDGGPPTDEGRPIVIEEWTTHPAVHHLPPADWLLDWVSEQSGDELTEDGARSFDDACHAKDVQAAAETLLSLIASKIGYRMAHKHVATWTFPPGTEDEPPSVETGVREPTKETGL